MDSLNMTMNKKLLPVQERLAIRERNLNNPDVEILLAESDELRKMLAAGSEANKTLQKLLNKKKKK